jgi:predicted nucleotide-binding protein
MYYHVGIKTKSNNKTIYAKYDIRDVKYIIDNFLVKYRKNESILISGTQIKIDDIEQIIIVETEQCIQVWKYEKNLKKPSNLIMIIRDSDVFYEKNIFDELYNSMSVEQTNVDSSKNIISIEQKNVVSSTENNKIFIVHGHNEEMLNDVELFVRRIDYSPIIIKDMPNKGMTIIEKIEENSDACYAIVLYSGCDIGYDAEKPEHKKRRARQNVVFEHGYLMGKLSRKRVCALVNGEIEKPSDISGIVYISYEKNWQSHIVKELKSLGMKVKDDWMW